MRTAPLLTVLCTVLCTFVFGVTCSLTSSPHTVHVLPHNDLPSVLTWAVLDPDYVAVTMEDLNATLSRRSASNSRPFSEVLAPPTRRRRTVTLQGDPFLDLEFRFKVPLIQVIEDTFVNAELPINIQTEIPLDDGGRGGSREMMPALLSLEKLIGLTGMDGRACVLRTICELSSTKLLQPHGLAGELLGIFVRNMVDITDDAENEYERENEVEGRAKETSDSDEVMLKDMTKEYLKAGLKGREGGECWRAFPECPVSLFNLLHSF